jgi:hypothetical protein
MEDMVKFMAMVTMMDKMDSNMAIMLKIIPMVVQPVPAVRVVQLVQQQVQQQVQQLVQAQALVGTSFTTVDHKCNKIHPMLMVITLDK